MDVYLACTLAETYRTLVLERRWSPDDFERWQAELLVRELLQRPRRRRTRPPAGNAAP